MSNDSNNALPTSSPEQWVALHGDALYRYAVIRVRDRSNAEDLVQETFMAALTSRQTFAGQSAERTWFIGILKHKLADFWRRTKRHESLGAIPSDDDPDQLLAKLFDATASNHWRTEPCIWRDPDAAIEQKEFWRVMTDCVEGLPYVQAQAFCLCEIDGETGPEVCKVLDVAPTNLWILLHRARLRLRECLERHWFSRTTTY
jgi:RNA polymerase sigma-70 factor, ECF subfamily